MTNPPPGWHQNAGPQGVAPPGGVPAPQPGYPPHGYQAVQPGYPPPPAPDPYAQQGPYPTQPGPPAPDPYAQQGPYPTQPGPPAPDPYAQQGRYPPQPGHPPAPPPVAHASGYPPQPPPGPPTGHWPPPTAAPTRGQPAAPRATRISTPRIVAAVLIAVVFVGVPLGIWALPRVLGQPEIDPARVDRVFANTTVALQNEPNGKVDNPQSYFAPSSGSCVNASNQIFRTATTAQVIKSPDDNGATETGYILAWKDTQEAQEAFDKLRPALIHCHGDNKELSRSGGGTRYAEIEGQLNPAGDYQSIAVMQYGNVIVIAQRTRFHSMPVWYKQVAEAIKDAS